MKKSSELGFTLVEMVMATAITGIIVSFLGTAIYQIFTVSEYGNDRLTTMHELQNASYWFNLDGQQAKTATGGSGLTLTLSDNSSVTYSLVSTELRRTAGGAQMTLARNITSASFSVANRTITMQLTSAPQGRHNVSEDGTYKVYLRPSEVSG
jgi:prepilin-type N-terminal cleavage/methylation domain-containing protein